MDGANPPSSPTLHASWPYLALMTDFKVWYTSHPMIIASVNDFAPIGRIMNSWNARRLPAWDPPNKRISELGTEGAEAIFIDHF